MHPLAILQAAAGAAPAADGPPVWFNLLPIVAMGVVMWLLFLRPQMRQQKEHRTRIEALKKGDMVHTGGGLLAKVVKLDGSYVDLELGTGMKVRALKSTIADVVPPAGAAPAND